MTASSLRLSSQPASSPGDTTSASWRLPRLRHLPASPSASLTTMSVRPASLRAATRLDPMNPAPPVTNNMRFLPVYPAFALPQRAQRCNLPVHVERECHACWRTGHPGSGGLTASSDVRRANSHRAVYVDRRFRSLPHGRQAAAATLPLAPDRRIDHGYGRPAA